MDPEVNNEGNHEKPSSTSSPTNSELEETQKSNRRKPHVTIDIEENDDETSDSSLSMTPRLNTDEQFRLRNLESPSGYTPRTPYGVSTPQQRFLNKLTINSNTMTDYTTEDDLSSTISTIETRKRDFQKRKKLSKTRIVFDYEPKEEETLELFDDGFSKHKREPSSEVREDSENSDKKITKHKRESSTSSVVAEDEDLPLGSPVLMKKPIKKVNKNKYKKKTGRFYDGRMSMQDHSRYIETKQFIFEEEFPQQELQDEDYYDQDEILKRTLNMEDCLSSEPKRGFPLYSNLKLKEIRINSKWEEYTPSSLDKEKSKTPPLPSSFKNMNELVRSRVEIKRKNRWKVECIELTNLQKRLTQKELEHMNTFQKTRVLILVNVKLTNVQLEALSFPNLENLDISNNEITQVQSVVQFVKNTNLKFITCNNNYFVQESTKWLQYIICVTPHIQVVNGKIISEGDRMKAIRAVGDNSTRDELPKLKWNETMNKLCKRLGLTKWDPTKITSLILPHAEISEFHIGSMANLRILDLSHNLIVRLKGTGIINLTNLSKIDLSYNRMNNTVDLIEFKFCNKLLHVSLKQNEFLTSDDYRARLINITRNLPGTNRMPGLQTIDDVNISTDERIKAIKKYCKKEEQVKFFRWELALVERFGHKQLRFIPQFMSRGITKLVFRKANLEYVDVTQFRALEYLDLSLNRSLIEIAGIEHCRRIKFLNLTACTKMRSQTDGFPKLMEQLSTMSNLRHIVFFSEKHRTKFQKFRQEVINCLTSQHSKLCLVDRIKITLEERNLALKSWEDAWTDHQLNRHKYLFHVAIMEQIVPILKRSYDRRRVVPGKLYDISKVTCLCLSNMNFSEYDFHFYVFTSLEKLDLSNNEIKTCTELQLEKCKELKVLDLSYNKITNKVSQLIDFVNNFPKLEIFAIHHNPKLDLSSGNQRMKFIKGLDQMNSFNSYLQIVDVPITAVERKEIVRHFKSGESEEERFQIHMEQRGYVDCATDDITTISLNDTGLAYINLQEYSNVEFLLLRGCRFKTFIGTGILSLTKLRVVDIRYNNLHKIDEILELIQNNPNLESLSIEGNKFSGFSSKHPYRKYLIGSTDRLRSSYCPFWELDGQEITVDEIVDAWLANTGKKYKKEMGLFRFHTAVYKQYITHVDKLATLREVEVMTQNIRELNIEKNNLTRLDFRGFENLMRLCLRKNAITDSLLFDSGLIEHCPNLKQLDISYNRIKKLDTIARLVNQLPMLDMIFFNNQECYTSDKQLPEFLSMCTGTSLPEWKLKWVNGEMITVNHRIQGLKISKKMAPSRIEQTRIELHMNIKDYSELTADMDFNACQIRNISSLSYYPAIVKLDLSYNNLEFIDAEVMKSLANLQTLNLKNNSLTIENVLDNVSQAFSLEVLQIQGNNGVLKKDPDTYVDMIFRTMRSLVSCDTVLNKYPLTDDQQNAAAYLLDRYGISPNRLRHFDLTFSKIEKRHFWSIVFALRAISTVETSSNKEKTHVGPESLKIIEGNFESTQVFEYRFLLIAHIPSLKLIDGHEVSEAERVQVATSVRQLAKFSKKSGNAFLNPILNLKRIGRDLIQRGKTIENNEEEQLVGGVESDDEASDDDDENPEENEASEEEENPEENPKEQNEEPNEKSTSLIIERKTPQEEDKEQGQIIAEDTKEEIPMVKKERLITPLDVDYYYIENNYENIPILKLHRDLISKKNKPVQSLGTIVDKLEHIIFFAQIFAILYSFNIDWPSNFSIIAQVFSVFNLSLEVIFDNNGIVVDPIIIYFKYALTMFLPMLFLLLFIIPMKKSQWNFVLYKYRSITLFLSTITWILSLLLSIGIGLASEVSDFETARGLIALNAAPTVEFYVVAGTLAAMFTLFYLLFLGNLILFNLKRHDDSFWNAFFLKFSNRYALFLMVISYMPVMRAVFVVYQCKGTKLFLFPNSNYLCPSRFWVISEWHGLYYVSAIFGVIYIILIPFLFIIMIIKDYRVIRMDNSFDQDELEIRRLRTSLFKEYNVIQKLIFLFAQYFLPVKFLKIGGSTDQIRKKKMDIVRRMINLREKYESAVQTYNSGTSFLYSPYRKNMLFYRIISLFERVLLTALASTIYSYQQYQVYVGVGVLAVFIFIVLVTRPYLYVTMDISEIVLYLNGIAMLLVGYLTSIYIPNNVWTRALILYIINGITLVVLVISVFEVPIRALVERLLLNYRTKRGLQNEDALRNEEEEEEEDVGKEQITEDDDDDGNDEEEISTALDVQEKNIKRQLSKYARYSKQMNNKVMNTSIHEDDDVIDDDVELEEVQEPVVSESMDHVQFNLSNPADNVENDDKEDDKEDDDKEEDDEENDDEEEDDEEEEEEDHKSDSLKEKDISIIIPSSPQIHSNTSSTNTPSSTKMLLMAEKPKRSRRRRGTPHKYSLDS